ncbi:UNVERIFIED_CONTAM: hypothetical protein FKN15_054068 [Acipenser sinensis]
MRCFKCGAQGHQRKNCPRIEPEEEQGETGGEEVRDDRGEREEDPRQPEPLAGPGEPTEQIEQTAETPGNHEFTAVERKRKKSLKTLATDLKENESVLERSSGAVSLDQGLSQPVSSEGADGEGIGLRSDKRLRFESWSRGTAGVESRAAGAPDLNPGRSDGGSRSLPGAAVPPCSEGEERSAESLLGAAVNPSLSDSQQTVAELKGEEQLKILAAAVNDSDEEYEEGEMGGADGGEVSDSSLFSDITDSQTTRKKLYSVNKIREFLDQTKGEVIAQPETGIEPGTFRTETQHGYRCTKEPRPLC